MSLADGKLIIESDRFRVIQSREKRDLLFEWKPDPALSVQDFQRGLAQFAEQCRTHKPSQVLIDAAKLDPASPALAWVSGQDKTEEAYPDWWVREIVPAYNDAGLSKVAVATGNPNAPGVVDVPPSAQFKMGYFADLAAATDWLSAARVEVGA